jgi:murein hydrolase activator
MKRFRRAPVRGTTMRMVNRIAPILGIACACVLAASAHAQQQPKARDTAPTAAEAASLDVKRQRELDLRQIEEALRRTSTENAQLAAEIAQLRGDRARLNAELVAASQRVREAEARTAATEDSVRALAASEAALKRSLGARSGTIAEVLASLQRIGRKPPPAVLVRPEDIMQSIRTSMLLGAVLPELRQEAQIIVQDLSALVETREAAARERDKLAAETELMRAERQRVAALIAARQSQLETGESRLVEERRKIQQLVREAQSLKELIARMEAEIVSVNRAALAASAVPLPTQNPALAALLAPGALKDMARLQPKIAFQDTKGTLSLPATGSIVKTFGAPDGFGGRESGMSVTTGKLALVTAPADGWVSFAGNYRSYGQVLIINAGGGYRMVLTGLDKVTVDIGQFVLAGEPVASMGETPAGALAPDTGAGNPVIYIEIRKDGVPIDPGPWWAKPDGEKVRG